VGGGSASPSIAEISLRRRELPERADFVAEVGFEAVLIASADF
jgi:hypothetical protein